MMEFSVLLSTKKNILTLFLKILLLIVYQKKQRDLLDQLRLGQVSCLDLAKFKNISSMIARFFNGFC